MAHDENRPPDSDSTDWDAIFDTQPRTDESGAEAGDGDPQAGVSGRTPASRREARRASVREGRRRRRWIAPVVTVLVLLGLVGGSAAFVWANFETQVRKVMGWEIPPEDYEGTGTGEVTIVIKPGDTGGDVAQTLVDSGVVASYGAIWELFLAENPQFHPGYYLLANQMSVQAALDALLDPANKLENTALLREGLTAAEIFELLSAATDIPVEEFEAAAADPTAFGVPADAQNMEGYLFPARYTFDPEVDANGVISILVNRTFQSLDTAGVAPEDRHRVLTIASLIQREAGSKEEDFYKVSRVIQNRLSDGMLLQFDSTSHYGYQWAHGERPVGGVFSTKEELEDPNPYNTYVHTGLPPGPISSAGDQAIDAAQSPADGPWRYFVTVNLETGETEFNENLSGHERSVSKMRQWCAETKSPNC